MSDVDRNEQGIIGPRIHGNGLPETRKPRGATGLEKLGIDTVFDRRPRKKEDKKGKKKKK